jgi:hypothetical protein
MDRRKDTEGRTGGRITKEGRKDNENERGTGGRRKDIEGRI